MVDTKKEYTEAELKCLVRNDLFAIAKAKAKEQGKVISYGPKKNDDLIDMILGKKPFAEKAEKLRQTPERVPLGGFKQKLVIPEHLKDDRYMNRIINDYGARIDDALRAGYEFIIDDSEDVDIDIADRRQAMGAAIKYNVGPDRDGKPMVGYAMRIRKEFYEEDQKAKQVRVDEIDNEIRRGEIGNAENRYVPQHTGIKISSDVK